MAEKYLLIATDGVSIDSTAYTTEKEASEKMQEAYKLNTPSYFGKMKYPSSEEEMSYCCETSAILYTGSTCLLWDIAKVTFDEDDLKDRLIEELLSTMTYDDMTADLEDLVSEYEVSRWKPVIEDFLGRQEWTLSKIKDYIHSLWEEGKIADATEDALLELIGEDEEDPEEIGDATEAESDDVADDSLRKHAYDPEAIFRLISEADGEIAWRPLNSQEWELLKKNLFMAGRDALEDFLGEGWVPDDYDKDTVENLLDGTLDQMPTEEQRAYYRKYVPLTNPGCDWERFSTKEVKKPGQGLLDLRWEHLRNILFLELTDELEQFIGFDLPLIYDTELLPKALDAAAEQMPDVMQRYYFEKCVAVTSVEEADELIRNIYKDSDEMLGLMHFDIPVAKMSKADLLRLYARLMLDINDDVVCRVKNAGFDPYEPDIMSGGDILPLCTQKMEEQTYTGMLSGFLKELERDSELYRFMSLDTCDDGKIVGEGQVLDLLP